MWRHGTAETKLWSADATPPDGGLGDGSPPSAIVELDAAASLDAVPSDCGDHLVLRLKAPSDGEVIEMESKLSIP